MTDLVEAISAEDMNEATRDHRLLREWGLTPRLSTYTLTAHVDSEDFQFPELN